MPKPAQAYEPKVPVKMIFRRRRVRGKSLQEENRKPAETGNLTVGHRPMSAYVTVMSETTASADEKQRPAHWFKPGQSGNPRGRTKGSRSKFSQAFVEDLSACWERHGIVALEKCATTEPAQFLRVCASLMPRDVDLNLSVDAVSFAASFEHALSVLGVEAPKQPKAKVIEHQVTSGPHR